MGSLCDPRVAETCKGGSPKGGSPISGSRVFSKSWKEHCTWAPCGSWSHRGIQTTEETWLPAMPQRCEVKAGTWLLPSSHPISWSEVANGQIEVEASWLGSLENTVCRCQSTLHPTPPHDKGKARGRTGDKCEVKQVFLTRSLIQKD